MKKASALKPDSFAVVDLGTDRRLTYAELNDRAERLAAVLSVEFGIAAGDRVAIYSQNTTNPSRCSSRAGSWGPRLCR